MVGWIAVFSGVIAWLANPLVWLSWIAYAKQKYRLALGLSILALMTALSFLWVESILADEGGGYKMISGYGVGYWLWLLSMLIMGVVNGIALKNKANVNR